MIGAGFFAGIQAEAWSRLSAAEITAVADPLLDKAQEFATKWGIPQFYADVDQMLLQEKPDFVDIVTRPETHLQLVRQVATHGCNIICQKPLAPTYAECEAMIATCQKSKVRLLVHENWRWQPWYREIQRLHTAKSLGRIFQLNFHVRTGDGWGKGAYTVQPYFREMQRLLIYETLVHHIDTTRFLAGEVVNLSCRTQRINQQIVGEDCATIQLSLQEGGQALIDANRINGPVPAPLVFGTVELEAEHGAIRLDNEARLWLNIYGQGEQRHEYEWANQGYRGDSVYATQAHLIGSLLDGTPAETEADQYLKTVSLVEACYESADDHRDLLMKPTI